MMTRWEAGAIGVTNNWAASKISGLGGGKCTSRGEPILLQEWPVGDSRREEAMSVVYHCLLKLATSSVWLETIHR